MFGGLTDSHALGPAAISQCPHHYASAVYSDAHLELEVLRVSELPNRLQHFKRATDHARCVVLVGVRKAEIDLDAVATILRYESAVPKYDSFAGALVVLP